MTQKGKRKSVSYYFRIEFSTLQGKITSGFCLFGLLGAILMGITSCILKPALEKSQYIVNTLDTSERHLLTLSANTEKALILVNHRLALQQDITNTDISRVEMLLQAPLDSLNRLSGQWQTIQAGLNLKVARLKAERLQKKIKGLQRADGEQLAEIYRQELIPLQQTIHDQVAGIQQLHAAEKASLQESIKYRSENLFLILSICFVISLVLGGLFASYIIVRVLQEIRMLRDKILELAEGKLIAPIPPSRNELNALIQALNTLVDNLRNIQLFAREVGSGNFDSNISVFNGQHELGESLADMRHSLKTVAVEEKHRHWVTTGLAQFSELLRNAADDLATYYQTLISELVSYLQVNQAAIYVAEEQEDESTRLVLKASYAYGRLKFQDKILEPGQGLVGQVFLEKEAQYLNKLPTHYLQISSGLGEAPPTHLVIIPLKVNEEVNGVLELASFHALAAHEIEFLNKITENISGALHNINNAQTTTRLLEEARSMAQAVQAQEEMLRQNSEELIATQEQLNRDLQENSQKLSFMEKALQQGAFPQLVLTDAGKVYIANAQATAFFHRPLQGIHMYELIPQDELINSISSMQPGTPTWLPFTHPGSGKASLCLQSFTMEGKTYINLQILPEALVALS